MHKDNTAAGWLFERIGMRFLILLLPVLIGGPATANSAPGVLIDVGGYRLHIQCEGYGTPTVVFDVGLGGSALEWRAVVNEVREFTRVCTYDRAGYGWSDMGPLPRTSSVITNELYLALETLDYERPFVLVGHSYGGYTAQLFSRRYPYLVAGIVLVDSSHPSQVERFLAPPIGLNTMPTSRWGVVKFGDPPEPHASLPENIRRLVKRQTNRWRTRRTLANETLGFRDSAKELRSAQPLPEIPLVVISRGKRVWPENERGNLLEKLWIDLQKELSVQSPLSSHIVAHNSGHHIHLDQPKLVAYAIAVLVDRYRVSPSAQVAAERQELTRRHAIDFRAASWLRDTLSMQSETSWPDDTASALTTTR